MTSAAAIINWNSGHFLRACIESLLTTSSETEIVVVDNASVDDSLNEALGFRDRVDFIRNSVNRGFAGAVNQAFEATTTSYVLVLNPDVHVTPGAVQYLERFMNEHPKAGAVGGHLNDSYLPRTLPTLSTLVRENLGMLKRPSAPSSLEPREVDQPAAAALMIRRSAYEEVHGFDEQFYPAWYEDVDFCHRLKAAGWQIYFAPQARFLHEGGYSAQVLGPSGFTSAYYRNQLRYVRKHFGRLADISVRGSIAVGMIGRMAAQPVNAAAYWKALVGALREW